jgi:hypothetical protein
MAGKFDTPATDEITDRAAKVFSKLASQVDRMYTGACS